MDVMERLKRYREGQGLRVEELAERSGVSAAYIWQIENGRRPNPSSDVAMKLAAALGATVGELLGQDEVLDVQDLGELPASLQDFVAGRGSALRVRKEDVVMLQRTHFRGRRPETAEDWELLYLFLKKLLGPPGK